ncbi:MAG: winged helix-turn-helix transcriptional regulator [Rhizobiales bacterium]|nr:winged helix-turn-helix transcriptional regulator [Hyphomicrobiales bacterium]
MIQTDQAQPVFRALADPTRRAIVAMLADGERPVGDIASEFQMTRPAVAKHLAILREGGLISVEIQGRERINRLIPDRLKAAADWINHFDRFWDERLAKLKQIVEKE